MAKLYLLFVCHNQLVPCLHCGCCSPASPCARFSLPAWCPHAGYLLQAALILACSLGSPSSSFSCPSQPGAWCRAPGVQGCKSCCGSRQANTCAGNGCAAATRQSLPPDGHGLPKHTGTVQQARGCLERMVKSLVLLEVTVWCCPLAQQSNCWVPGSWQIELARPGLVALRPFMGWSRGGMGLCFPIAGQF